MRRLAPALAAFALVTAPASSEGLDPDLRALVETVVAARERYVDPAEAGRPEAVQAAIRAFLQSFGDPATRYLPSNEWERLETAARGRFQGYGVLITRLSDGYVIERAYPEAPAYRAGLRDGDQIVAVGGRRSLPETLDELRDLLHASERGVTLAVRRHGRELTVALRKGDVSLPSLEQARLAGDVHYLRIRSFTERGPEELAAMLPAAQSARSVILDLRGNAGGVLDAAVEMHGLLAGPGPVTWIVDRSGSREIRRTRRRPHLSAPPAIVLVDRGTASAAEVLAASLSRQGSLVLGEATYGKGTIQEVVPLADGGAAVITVARYEIAPGKPLPETGLVPDAPSPLRADGAVPFPPSPADDPGLTHALETLRQGARTSARRGD
jgi:carboxyl-terminal processing protease